MVHRISAIVIPGSVTTDSAAEFDAKLVDCLTGFTLIALDDDYVDAWAERLGISGVYADTPILNARVVHHIANVLGNGRPFAIIETEYHGGQGSQSAAAYHSDVELMAPVNAECDAINSALRLLGVTGTSQVDEFDTLGLNAFRLWGDLFDAY